MDLRSSQRVQAPPRYEAATTAPESAPPVAARKRRDGLRGKKKLLIGAAGLLALVVLALVALWLTGGGALGSVQTNKYQAVFLSNGQVYFGKISSITPETMTLRDIYYLQQQSNIQTQDKKQETPANQLSLAKLGNELHGPQDVMYIERSQVLFWENLKDSDKSQVVKIIEQEKQSKNN